MRILVSAGPTREHLDPVRFLSNESSGKMGFEIARAARRRGHEVVLVAGPVCLATPPGVRRIDVTSALEMLAALRGEFQACDALVMTAAVADFRPRRRLRQKWKAKETGEEPRIELVRNPDLLAALTRRKGPRRVMAFALETSHGLRRAAEKLRRKNADLIVLNDASALSADRTSVTILDRDGNCLEILDRAKAAVARALVRLLE